MTESKAKQRRVQNPVKHLRWNFFFYKYFYVQYKLKIHSHLAPKFQSACE